MHSKSDRSIVMIGYDTDEIIQELFDPLLHRYQIGREQTMKGTNFIFDCILGMYYRFSKISFDYGGSYMDCPKLIKNKTSSNKSKKNDNGFQYAITVALNHK